MGALVQVGGEDDTLNSERPCLLCAARAAVDAALVRAGVERLTIVADYTTPPLDTATVERAKAIITRNGEFIRGDGHSREEAIVSALASAGVEL